MYVNMVKSIFDSESEMEDSDEFPTLVNKSGDFSTNPVVGRAESEKVSKPNDTGNHNIVDNVGSDGGNGSPPSSTIYHHYHHQLM